MHKEDYDSLTPLERQAALLEYAVLDEDGEKFWNNRRRLSKMEKVLPMIPLHTEI